MFDLLTGIDTVKVSLLCWLLAYRVKHKECKIVKHTNNGKSGDMDHNLKFLLKHYGQISL